MYKSTTQLWEEHIASFDEAIVENVKSNEIFVDGGCGKERFVERYSGQFENCIGIDIDIKQRNNGGNIHFIKGDLEFIPLKSDCIDAFLTNFVLEHVRRPKRFFSEVSRIMKPNGLLIIWTPNVYSISGIVIRTLPFPMVNYLKKVYYGIPSYPVYYRSNSPSKLDTLLGNFGFEKVKMEMKDGVFYFSEYKLIRWFHSMFIKFTDCDGFSRFKDLIFAIYLKSA